MATGTYKTTTNPTAVYGENSPAVLALQKKLNLENAGKPGYTPIAEDAKYGPLTQAAVNFKPVVPPTPGAGANNIPGTGGTSNFSFLSSSSSEVNNENQIKNDISRLTIPNTSEEAARKASEDYQKLLDDRMAKLEARRKEEVASLEASFGEAAKKQELSQTKETGTTNVALMRTGGYLGTQISGVGVLNNLAQTHREEVAALTAKKAAAIQEANSAIDDKQFDLARLKAAEVKDLDKEINDRRNKFFDQALELQKEDRAQDEAYRTKIKEDLDMLGKLGSIDEAINMDPNKVAEIDSYYGVPGFTKQYLTVVNNAAKAKSQKELLDNQKNLLDLIQAIPQGQKVTFPDGTEYTGMGKTSDITTFMQVDSQGNGHLITYNKGSGRTSVQNLGPVGKQSGGAGGAGNIKGVAPEVVDNITNKIQTTLESNGKQGKYYDPDVYIGVREELKKNYPQLLTYYDGLFLNKSNGFFSNDAIDRLRKKGIFYGGPGTTEPELPGAENQDIIQEENKP